MSIFGDKKEEVCLLVDIGNGNITGALVLFVSNQQPKFLYTIKTDFTISDKPESSKLIEAMGRILDDTFTDIMKYGFDHNYWKNKGKKLDNVIVAFSSPWFMPKTKHIHLSKDKPFIISESFLADITQKEEEVFKKELAEELKDENNDSFEVIEKSIVHIKINGYTIENSIGSETKIFDAHLCMSVVNKNVIEKVYNLILKHTLIPRNKVLVHSFPLVSFSVVRDIFTDHSNFMLMDVTGEVTDLTLVQNDVIVGTTSFPSGRNYIIRKIGQVFDVPAEIAESTLHMYLSGKSDSEASLKVENILENLEKEWSIYVLNTLLELSPEMVLPRRLYLTANEDVAPIYMDFMKLPKNDVTLNFRKNIDLVHLDNKKLSHFYTTNSMVQVNEFIALLSIFYNKIIQPKIK